MRTFVHIFEQVKQDWQAVTAIIENTAHQVRTHLPHVKEMFLRSDNAGCYKAAALLLCLPQIEQTTGKFFHFLVIVFSCVLCMRITEVLVMHIFLSGKWTGYDFRDICEFLCDYCGRFLFLCYLAY